MHTNTDAAADLFLPLLIIVMLCQSLGYAFDSFVPLTLASAYMVVQKALLLFYGKSLAQVVERVGLGGQMLLARANLNIVLAVGTVGAFLAVTGA